VRECFKGRRWKSMGKGEIWPPLPENPWTKICMGNNVGDIYHHAKFYPKRFRGFGSAHAWFRAPQHKVTRLFFWWGGSWERLQPRPAHRFWRKIRQSTRFRARKCFFGVAKPKSKVSTRIFPKNRHFGPHFDGTIFSPQKGLNIGRLDSKQPLIVVVAQ